MLEVGFQLDAQLRPCIYSVLKCANFHLRRTSIIVPTRKSGSAWTEFHSWEEQKYIFKFPSQLLILTIISHFQKISQIFGKTIANHTTETMDQSRCIRCKSSHTCSILSKQSIFHLPPPISFIVNYNYRLYNLRIIKLFLCLLR